MTTTANTSTSLHASWLDKARVRAEGKGHTLGPFRQNGSTNPIYVAQCKKCLCYCLVDPARIGPNSDGQEGVALYWQCDSTVDRNCEFIHSELSAEYKARMNRPWRAPSEG